MSENIPKQANGFKVSRSTTLWVFVGLALSSSFVVAISFLSGVTVSDFEQFGLVPFVLAGVVSSARLLIQVLRYRVVVFGLSGVPKSNFKGLSIVRIGSEFVSLTTPSLIGGVVVRAAWLSQKGVDSGRAFWIAYFEVLMDVYIGSIFAIAAAAYAFFKGATIIGTTISVIVGFQLIFYSIIFLIPALRGLPLFPKRLFQLAEYFVGGTKAKTLEAKINQATKTFSLSARSVLKRDALPVILKAAGLTLVDAGLLGLALWIILNRAGLSLDPILSMVASFGVSTIAIVPISIGGSGIAELAMHSFLSAVFAYNNWTAVLIWRIVSFQFLLIPSGIAFAFLMRKTIWAKITLAPSVVETNQTKVQPNSTG